ncbi:hypothetical protein OJF2_48480 [Aquisphaera giovannonii]|uniref:Uncharacterized protein n=1 Tax=Aquisphaera giovannonii TaxID=406548 RepID=A0A5B9W6V5_9BACT|nr:hypothetical protein [Aquisphaera giovannonii]QEH36288.1 hypothetical protein OJF2_48480 [Aquisphaera giovannonii]
MRSLAMSRIGLAASSLSLAFLTWLAGDARGQQPRTSRPSRAIAPASAAACEPCGQPAALGTFAATPYIMVRGNWPAGGGYTGLVGSQADQSESLYGPLSPLRSVSAPVTTYTRGYDGRVHAARGTSASTPNLPALTPVVYPTQGSYYYGPREDRSPPNWSTGWNWIDQR